MWPDSQICQYNFISDPIIIFVCQITYKFDSNLFICPDIGAMVDVPVSLRHLPFAAYLIVLELPDILRSVRPCQHTDTVHDVAILIHPLPEIRNQKL